MPTLPEIRATLVEVSRRHSRVDHEAEDLAHDIMVSALRRGIDLESESFLRSLGGASRRHGAFVARSAGRRRVREASSAVLDVADWDLQGEDHGDGVVSVSSLSSPLRTTLLLLLGGLDKAELGAALGVTDAALRKRFQLLRQRGPFARPVLPSRPRTPASTKLRGVQVKLLPKLAGVLADTGREGPVIALGDPDGHGLIFSGAFTLGGHAATTPASSSTRGRNVKGTSC